MCAVVSILTFIRLIFILTISNLVMFDIVKLCTNGFHWFWSISNIFRLSLWFWQLSAFPSNDVHFILNDRHQNTHPAISLTVGNMCWIHMLPRFSVNNGHVDSVQCFSGIWPKVIDTNFNTLLQKYQHRVLAFLAISWIRNIMMSYLNHPRLNRWRQIDLRCRSCTFWTIVW